jgi:hypothetical protein
MSATAALAVHSFPVGSRTVTMTVPKVTPGAVQCLACEWEPDMPHKLSRHEMRQYRKGRDALMRKVARLAGGKVAVVEV